MTDDRWWNDAPVASNQPAPKKKDEDWYTEAPVAADFNPDEPAWARTAREKPIWSDPDLQFDGYTQTAPGVFKPTTPQPAPSFSNVRGAVDGQPAHRVRVGAAESYSRGVQQGLHELSGVTSLLTMPFAGLIDTVHGAVSGRPEYGAADWIARNMVDPNYQAANELAINPETEEQGFGGRLAGGVGHMIPDLLAMLVTGGESAAAQGVVKPAVEQSLTRAVGDAVGKAALHSARATLLPGVSHGAVEALPGVQQGGDVGTAVEQVLGRYAEDTALNTLPLSAGARQGAGLLETIATKGAQGAVAQPALNATVAAMHGQNYDPQQAVIDAITGGLMAQMGGGEHPTNPDLRPLGPDENAAITAAKAQFDQAAAADPTNWRQHANDAAAQHGVSVEQILDTPDAQQPEPQPQPNPLAAAISNALGTPVDTTTEAGVQQPRPQSAGVPGENRGEVQQEARQGQEGEVQRTEGGRAAGRAGEEEAVQARQVAPAVESPLAPRNPGLPEVPDTLTKERAREDYRQARTDAERAAAAGRIAAVDARETAREQAARDANERGVRPRAENSIENARQDAPRADAAVPQEAEARPVADRVADGAEGNEGTAPALRRSDSAVTDRYTDTPDTYIREVLGPAAAGVSVHRTPADLHPEDRERLRITDADHNDLEGVYDPDTGRSHVFTDTAASRATRHELGLTPDQHRVWVAAHERTGHAGLRGLAAERAGSNEVGGRALRQQLDRAGQNPTVAAISKAMSAGRPETGARLHEEALAELSAAHTTGDYATLERKYGVAIPEAQRKTVAGFMQRLAHAVRSALGRPGEGMSDRAIYKLIADAGRYARTGKVRGTSRRAGERAPRSLSLLENNGSGDSSASIEAINRDRDERAAGQVRMLIDRDGTVRQLRGVDSVDTFARPGQIIVQHGIGRDKWTILSKGNDVSDALAQGRINAARDRLTEEMEDSDVIASRSSSSFLHNLTDREREKITDRVAAKIAAHLETLPSAEEMAAVAHAGRAKRGWYRQSAEAISAVFGPDAPRFASLLASLSPRVSVQKNLSNALQTWKAWNDAGRPTDREEIVDVLATALGGRGKILPAWLNNSVRVLSSDDPAATVLSGPKVDSFARNLVGDSQEVTNDSWMAAFARVDQELFNGRMIGKTGIKGKSNTYLAMNSRTREAAREISKLTGEEWTPAEVQETIWSWGKTLYELADRGGEFRSARELLDDGELTDDLLRSTPDFGTLFTDPVYAGILKEAGYGDQIEQLGSRGGNAREAAQEPGARGQAGPFAPETQRQHEQRAAGRLDAVRKARLDAERGDEPVTEAEEDVPFSRRATSKVYGEDQGTDLEGMPNRIRVGDRVVEFHGYAPAQEIAAKYAGRHGQVLPRTYAQVDVARAERIARAYEAMKHDPQDPEVRRAYADMIDETLDQYRDMLKTGIKIEFIDGADPYKNGPRDAILDVVENNHLWVYPTRSGFGSDQAFDPAENPLLADTEFEISGQRATANDIFRAVHDYFGHIANGVGFRADGEENAWREHSAMYSPLARRAMTTETRGQNSWLNYGPHGEKNRTAKTEDTVFADQKTGLLPEWVSEDGAGDESPVASRGFSAKKTQRDAESVIGYHYSPVADLTALDPSKAGTGAAGGERRRFGMGQFGQRGGTGARVAFYVGDENSIPKSESMVTGRNLYRTRLDNLYNIDTDPRGYAKEAGSNRDLLEELISDGGFDGFVASKQPGIDSGVAVVFDIGKRKIPVEPVDEAVASRRTPQEAQQERQQLLGHLNSSGFPQNNQPIQIAAGTGPLATVKAAGDSLRVKLQDKMLPLLRAQEHTGAANKPGVTSVTLDDNQNAYRLETLMHGAIKDRVEGGEKKWINPISARLKNVGMSVPTFEGYLLARVAPEVNAHVAKINKSMQDSGSGISTDVARGVLAGTAPNPYTGKPMTAEELRAASSIAQFVDGLRDATLDNMVAGHQITPKLAKDLRARYPNFVPLRGHDAPEWMGEQAPGTGRGLSGKRSPLKRRVGRGEGNLPQNILGEMVGDFQRSVIAREKAKVNQAFLRFALDNPMPELFNVEPVDLEWKYSEATGEAYLGVRGAADDADRSMIVMHEGEPVRIRFEDRALRDAMLNMGPDAMTGVVHWLGAINRWRSKVLTQYNPAFTPVNITRDAIFGMTALTAEHGPVVAAKAAAGYVPAMYAMFRQGGEHRGDTSKPVSQFDWDDWAREASENGMKTGLSHTDDVRDLQRRMTVASTSLMQLAAQGRPWSLARESVSRTLHPITETISRVNDATENALRLSAYVALRKRGMSAGKAGEYAKNMTINFNRKGQWGSAVNALYLFYNASMQGSHAVARVLRNPKVTGSLVALGALQGLLLRQMMQDDDQDGITDLDTIPAYVRRTSFIIPLGAMTGNNKDYFALPMPYGFNLFTYTGGRVSQWQQLGARESDPSFAADVFKAATDAFSPVQINGDYGSLYGDQLGFAMNLAANRDDEGRPLNNGNGFEDYPVPRALQGRASTPAIYQRTAQILAKIGGGDLKKRIPPVGYLDVSPEQVEQVANYMGGGLLQMVNKGMRWSEKFDADTFEGGMDMVGATPLFGRFANRGNAERAIADRYYGDRGELSRKIDVLQDDLTGLTDEQVPGVIHEAGRYDSTMRGLEADRYKRGSKKSGKEAGDIKRGDSGAVTLKRNEGSTADAFSNADKAVKALGKQINSMRADDLTVKDVVDIGLANEMTLADIGVPENYNGDAPAPTRIRNRVIDALQKAREKAEQRALQTEQFNRVQSSVDDYDKYYDGR